MAHRESVVPLSRAYTCRYGAPALDRVDVDIYRWTYFARCMECGFCQDACCQYGADIEAPRVDAILARRDELEAYLGVPRDKWFRDDPSDIWWVIDPDYPGGEYTRTGLAQLPDGRSSHNTEACVFLDPTPGGRGCRLHRFALERGIDVHDIKPMVCLLFPVSFSEGLLCPAYEFQLDGELVCQGPGETVYRSARPDILYYFGPELVAELDELERTISRSDGGAMSLPMCAS
jgi:Fe-S-cluster containining protein